MRGELLELLQCPGCRRAPLTLALEQSDALEARTGTLGCSCGASYRIERGIPDLTVPGESLDRARAHAFAEACEASGLIASEADLLDFEQRHRRLGVDQAHRFCHGLIDNFDRAIDAMAIAPGLAVLDVGAGATWSTAHLARLGARAVAVDLVRPRWAGLEAAESFLARGPYYERVVAMMDRLPFRDQSFDRVLFHAALHHADDLAATAREAARVLRPDGALWLVNEPVGSWLGLFDGRFSEAMRDTGEHLHPLADYSRAVAAAGLELRLHYAPGAGARLDALARRPVLPPPTRPGQALKYSIVRATLAVWRRSPRFRAQFEKRFYFHGLRLFGQFLLAEARKPRGRA